MNKSNAAWKICQRQKIPEYRKNSLQKIRKVSIKFQMNAAATSLSKVNVIVQKFM